jgi:hypothetical protein
MNHGDAQQDARRLAASLLDVHGRRDFIGLAHLVTPMIGSRAPGRRLFGPLLAELVAVVARLIKARAGEGGDVFTVGLTEEITKAGGHTAEAAVDIDELNPPLRAVLRAVLAELNGDPDATATQLKFASDGSDPLERLDALVHLLSWVDELRPPERHHA